MTQGLVSLFNIQSKGGAEASRPRAVPMGTITGNPHISSNACPDITSEDLF